MTLSKEYKMNHLATIRDTKFHYQVRGHGAPLVLIAGFTADHTVWSTVIESLEKKFTVLTFDNRLK